MITRKPFELDLRAANMSIIREPWSCLPGQYHRLDAVRAGRLIGISDSADSGVAEVALWPSSKERIGCHGVQADSGGG